jgi:hypothetical protein
MEGMRGVGGEGMGDVGRKVGEMLLGNYVRCWWESTRDVVGKVWEMLVGSYGR